MPGEPVGPAVVEIEECFQTLARIRAAEETVTQRLGQLHKDGLLWAEIIKGDETLRGRFGRVAGISTTKNNVYVRLRICSKSKPYRALNRLPRSADNIYNRDAVRFVRAVQVDDEHVGVVISGTTYVLKSSDFRY
jgi:hypothetical protein